MLNGRDDDDDDDLDLSGTPLNDVVLWEFVFSIIHTF